MAQRVEIWPIEKLRPYEKNARTHSAEQISQIAASIVEFGFTSPILVDGEEGVLAGHGRLAAARQLGLEQVPVVVLDHLTPTQRKAYILADNKIALNAGWDDALLAEAIEELGEMDFDLSLLGWGEDLPTFADEPDYSVLDDEDDGEVDQLAAGVKKAIQIEFEPEHYEEAQELVKFWRGKGGYVGMMLIEKLSAEKERL
jgi:ParB-like chromosome segregation protein Spo0J